ncbi:alpha/beta fold hydrolase [Caenimonas aquaedulcis]|uniref:Alpha/beta hydrolase n=1 Tax=Caenimonas aquaedulcis TaxID=2793270 RepID=A0A931H6E7_9BURK|nr:alpha/beta hydrolase [Caenimonas aquaedulcis]MBG9389441.1 alpha/beta hydrolase [Caenimonas aquaedulcis]
MTAAPPPQDDRATVVLLHSSAGSPRQWQELVEELRRDFRVLAVEFHGHGMRPDWPHERRMTLADDAGLVLPLLEMVGGAHVVGHSYGAAVALKLACMRPLLVHSVAAYEPVLFRLLIDDTAHPQAGADVLRTAASMRDRLKAGQPAQAARLFIDFWSGAGAWQSLDGKAQRSIEARMPSVIRHFEALFAEPFPREQLAHMAMPMLLLSGSRTVEAARRVARLLRAALPLAEHQELPGMGHMGPVTHAKAVNERIRQFLRPHARFASTSVLPGRALTSLPDQPSTS